MLNAGTGDLAIGASWEFRRDYPASFANQLSDFSFHHSGDKANLSEDGSRRLEKTLHEDDGGEGR